MFSRPSTLLAAWMILAIVYRVSVCPPWVPNLDGERRPSDRLVRQVYFPAATVFVDVGPDQQPGTADVDDGNNGIVDDPDETGANGTDDTFTVALIGESAGESFAQDRFAQNRFAPEVAKSGVAGLPSTAKVLARGGWITIASPQDERSGGIENATVTLNPPGQSRRVRTISVGDGYEAIVDWQ